MAGVEHFILRCSLVEERKDLFDKMEEMDGDLKEKSEKEQLAAIMDRAVRQPRVRKAVKKI